MTVLAVLDTNVFLHAQPFDELDWCKAIGVEKLVLVVVPTVLHELDEQKWKNPKEPLRRRAKKILEKLERLLDPSGGDAVIRQGVWLRLVTDEKPSPQIDVLNKDAAILASIVALRETGQSVIFVLSDVGASLVARAKGIGTKRLEDQYLLPAEQQDKLQPARPQLEVAVWLRGIKLEPNRLVRSRRRFLSWCRMSPQSWNWRQRWTGCRAKGIKVPPAKCLRPRRATILCVGNCAKKPLVPLKELGRLHDKCRAQWR